MKTLKLFPASVLFFISLFFAPLSLYSQPTITEISTDDTDSDGHIDRLYILFSETVDVTGAPSGLDCGTPGQTPKSTPLIDEASTERYSCDLGL